MTVNLSLETATEMYNSGVESLKAFALENYPELGKKPLPKTYKEAFSDVEGFKLNVGTNTFITQCNDALEVRNKDIVFRTCGQAEAVIALAQLSQLMAIYNDGWVPCYNGKEEYYTILISNNVPIAGTTRNAARFLVFKSEKLRNEFLKHFRDLIMQTKPLL